MALNEKSNNKPLPGAFFPPVMLIHLSSVVCFLLMTGHMSAYPWTSQHSPSESRLVGSMKSVDFVFLGSAPPIGVFILDGAS